MVSSMGDSRVSLMAQSPDGSGTSPVQITRQSTSITSGASVNQKLVSASVAFGNVIKGTFGPNGLDKMLYKTNGEAAVTNDGAKIIAELLVKHPAAKAFVSLAESQENACGDGVTGCVIFASELMSESGRLLERGIHPLVVVKGFQLALEETMQILEERSVSGVDKLESVARTALVGRSTEGALDHLAKLISSAVSTLPDSDYERVRMLKDGRGTPSSSYLVEGLIIEKRLALDRMPHLLSDCPISILSCPLEIESSVVTTEIEITTPEQYEAFIDSEQSRIEEIANRVISSGAKIVFCTENIDSRIIHMLADEGIYAISNLEKDIAEDVSESTSAMLCDHLDDIKESLGAVRELKHERLEGSEGVKERLTIKSSASGGIVSIAVGGTDGIAAEETIRGLYDSLRSCCLAKEDDSVLLGGGSLHAAAALRVKEIAESNSGRERLAMDAFARALESIPATLASNNGRDRIDTLLELRSKHRNGESSFGITQSGLTGKIDDVYIPAYTLEHSISAACETACGLLRVDQVISARGD